MVDARIPLRPVVGVATLPIPIPPSSAPTASPKAATPHSSLILDTPPPFGNTPRALPSQLSVSPPSTRTHALVLSASRSPPRDSEMLLCPDTLRPLELVNSDGVAVQDTRGEDVCVEEEKYEGDPPPVSSHSAFELQYWQQQQQQQKQQEEGVEGGDGLLEKLTETRPEQLDCSDSSYSDEPITRRRTSVILQSPSKNRDRHPSRTPMSPRQPGILVSPASTRGRSRSTEGTRASPSPPYTAEDRQVTFELDSALHPATNPLLLSTSPPLSTTNHILPTATTNDENGGREGKRGGREREHGESEPRKGAGGRVNVGGGKEWMQPEAVRKMFVDRARAIEGYYAHFPVAEAISLTHQAIGGATEALLAFQHAQHVSFVGAYDEKRIENVFDVFDVDCDGFLSPSEGLALLALWLKGALVHEQEVLHSLVAGLISCKTRMALALESAPRTHALLLPAHIPVGADEMNAGDSDDDVAWVRSETARAVSHNNMRDSQGDLSGKNLECNSMLALHLKAQERGELKASLVISSFGSRLAPFLQAFQSPQGLQTLYAAVLLPLHDCGSDISGVKRGVFVQRFCESLEGYLGAHKILHHLLKDTREDAF